MKPFTIQVNSASNRDSYEPVTFHDFKDFFNWLIIQDVPVIFYPPEETGKLPTMMFFDDYID